MRSSVYVADEVPVTEALKGRPMIAQGKAQRRPGLAFPENFQALKGRHNSGARFARRVRAFCFALSGLGLFLTHEPRALPWAIILRPVGAGNGERRAASAAVHPAPVCVRRTGRPFRNGGAA